jgi:subtilisin family serine protease
MLMNFRIRIIGIIILSLLVQPSFVFAKTFNDPLNNNLWYLDSLQMKYVWDYSEGDGITVAVIDSGVDTDHPDLMNKIKINQKEIFGDSIDNDGNGYVDDVKGWDFLDNDNDPKPVPIEQAPNCEKSRTCDYSAFYHGTALSGIFGAETDNAFGISGLAPRAKIMPLRVLDSSGSGSSSDVIKAVEYAVDNGANIINMSFVGLSDDFALTQSIERAYNRGVVVVVAAGNKEGVAQINLDINPRYPVCSVGSSGQRISLGVGAMDQNNILSTFSNYGSSCIDILAPGENIFGAVPNEPSLGFNEYFASGFRGTSLSAPMVSGAVALIRSYDPKLTVLQIFQLIRQYAKNISTSNPGFESKIGSGGLDILSIFQNINNVKPAAIGSISFGDVFKVNKLSTVYYYGNDGKRYVFPDSGTFFSWYPDFALVKSISLDEAAQLPLGGVVTYRPGVQLVKVATDPKVYAVDTKGVLRWVTNEDVAVALYGGNWSQKVRDLSDVYVFSYSYGTYIVSPSDFNLVSAINASRTINQDKAL